MLGLPKHRVPLPICPTWFIKRKNLHIFTPLSRRLSRKFQQTLITHPHINSQRPKRLSPK